MGVHRQSAEPSARQVSPGRSLQKSLSLSALAYAESAAAATQDGGPTSPFKSSSLKLICPIFFEPATRFRARVWAGAWLGISLGHVFLEYYNTQAYLNLSTSMELMDAESFYGFLFFWLVSECAKLLQEVCLEQSQWEVRTMVHWRLHFCMANALYSADTFYHMQGLQSNPALPGSAGVALISNDASAWLNYFFSFVQSTIMTVLGLCSTVFMLLSWSPMITLYMIVMFPIRARLYLWMYPSQLGKHYRLARQADLDFQFAMGRVADSSEQIALLRGGAAELKRFNVFVHNWQQSKVKIVLWEAVYQTMTQVTGTVIMLPVYYKLLGAVMNGDVSLSAGMMYISLCFGVQTSLGVLQNVYVSFKSFEPIAAQCVELLDRGAKQSAHARTLQLMAASGKESYDHILVEERSLVDGPGPSIDLRSVHLWVPGKIQQLVLSDYSVQLYPGQSMLVVGETGVGKSLLLRAIHGLWLHGCGMIHRCDRQLVACIPQRPFVFMGTLRDNLIYPDFERSDNIDESQMMIEASTCTRLLDEALAAVNLKSFVDSVGLDNFGQWQSVLSLGQQQRLGVARELLKRRTQLVLLDEATSALDLVNERRVYSALHKAFPNYISVAHRPSVREYHSHVTVMTLNPEFDAALAIAKFSRLEECDFSAVDNLSRAQFEGSREEQVWAMRRQALEAEGARQRDGGQQPPQPGESSSASTGQLKEGAKGKSEDTAEQTLSLPDLNRTQGPLSLFVRAVKDIFWPMFTERDVLLPVSMGFTMTYFFSYLGVAVEMFFGYPLSRIIGVIQTSTSRDQFWTFFCDVLIWYYFCTLLLQFLTVYQLRQFHSTTRIVIKKDLARRYLDPQTDAFYHLNLGNFLQGNPGSRISTWDTDSANIWVNGISSTLAGALMAACVAARDLYYMNKEAFTFFASFVMVGATFFHWVGGKQMDGLVNAMDAVTENNNRLLHVRENAEAVAMIHGCESERRRTFLYLDKSITHSSIFQWWKDAAKVIGNFYFGRFTSISIMFITGPMVLNGNLTFERQNMMARGIEAGARQIMQVCQSILTNVEGQLAMERLWELSMVTWHIKKGGPGIFGRNRWGGDIALEEEAALEGTLALQDLKLKTPAKTAGIAVLLVRNLSLQLPYGDSLLVAGESGIGKSSVLRAVAGLWRNGTGTICVSDNQKSLFIPQRPYLCVGTLREQLLYPRVERSDVSDDRMREVVRTVGLSHLLEHPGLDELSRGASGSRFWFLKLSLGEIQRIAFARMLLKEGLRLVFLDEATSALSVSVEETMYGLMKTHVSSFISVAHRPQLRRFHKRALVLLKRHSNADTEARVMPMAEYLKMLELDGPASRAALVENGERAGSVGLEHGESSGLRYRAAPLKA